MNRIKHRSGISKAVQVGVLSMFMTGFTAPGHALPQIDGLDLDQMSVRELMRIDAENALRQTRSQASEQGRIPVRPERAVRKMSGEPRLTAIYGVGRQLLAEVVVDQVIYLYRYGQALPVGVAPGEDVLLLQKISTSCVDLKNSEREHHLCLRPAQWVGK